MSLLLVEEIPSSLLQGLIPCFSPMYVDADGNTKFCMSALCRAGVANGPLDKNNVAAISNAVRTAKEHSWRHLHSILHCEDDKFIVRGGY